MSEITIHGRAVEMVAVGELKPFERNAREHPPEQIELLARVIADSGFTQPLVIDEANTIIAGHGRLLAAISLEMPEVPCVRASGLTDAQVRALRISDNQIGLLSSWDMEGLQLELGDLSAMGFDISLTGFSLGDGLLSLGLPGGASSGGGQAPAGPSLMDRFGIAPFSVLNAREGWWQDRKRAWIGLGIRSEVGRGENLLSRSLHERVAVALGMSIGPGTAYDRTRAFIDERRDAGKSDTDILREAEGTKGRRADAIPGGAGKNAAYRKGGAKPQPETASLKDGLVFGTTAHPYDASGQKKNAAALATPPGALYRTATPAKDPAFYAKKRKAEAALGREIDLEDFRANFYDAPTEASGAGTSIFDPVLAELALRWWCPPGGRVLDPFAGGSVRGIVSARLGRPYLGIDLRLEQIEANRVQAGMILGDGDAKAEWTVGDAGQVLPLMGEAECFDFILSCPPYADLERYSDDPADLSTMAYPDFLDAYEHIISMAEVHLKPDRFACFVVGDMRDKDGGYRGFVRDTELAFEHTGMRLYNHAILVTAAGSLALRAGRTFEVSRKLGKTHQNVLVFVKGDAFAATKAIGPCDFLPIEEAMASATESEKAPDGAQGGHQPAPQAPGKSGVNIPDAESTAYGERLLSLGGEVD